MTSNDIGHIMKGPLQLSIDITYRCNLCCLHCYNGSGDCTQHNFSDELNASELFALAHEIRELQPMTMCICGGEPLIRKNETMEFLRRLKNDITQPSMVSNGWFLDLETARQLMDSGLKSIQISVDGSDEYTHDKLRGIAGSYSRALSAVKIASEVGFEQISVAFSPTRFNVDQLLTVIDQMAELGVHNFRVQPLMKLGRGSANSELFLAHNEYRDVIRSIANGKYNHPQMRFEWGDPVDHLIRFASYPDFVPYVIIKANGDIVLSTYLPVVIGNVRRHKLSEYWTAGLYKIWGIKLFAELAGFYASTSDFSLCNEPLHLVGNIHPIVLDIIDDNLFQLNEMNINSLYWNRVSVIDAGSAIHGHDELKLLQLYVEYGQRQPSLSPIEVRDLIRVNQDLISSRNETRSPFYMLRQNNVRMEICNIYAIEEIAKFIVNISDMLSKNDICGELSIWKYRSVHFDENVGAVLPLRMRMFEHSLHCFAVYSDIGEIVALGLVSADSGLSSDKQHRSCSGSVEYLAATGTDHNAVRRTIAELLRFIEQNLWRVAVTKVEKLHVLLDTQQVKESFDFKGILEERKFFEEETFVKESAVMLSKKLF